MYRFEKLRVYHNALILVEEVYRLTENLPIEEKFALINQLKRSTTSIVLNIAEGTGALGDIEFKSFLRIALKSLYETVAGFGSGESQDGDETHGIVSGGVTIDVRWRLV